MDPRPKKPFTSVFAKHRSRITARKYEISLNIEARQESRNRIVSSSNVSVTTDSFAIEQCFSLNLISYTNFGYAFLLFSSVIFFILLERSLLTLLNLMIHEIRNGFTNFWCHCSSKIFLKSLSLSHFVVSHACACDQLSEVICSKRKSVSLFPQLDILKS